MLSTDDDEGTRFFNRGGDHGTPDSVDEEVKDRHKRGPQFRTTIGRPKVTNKVLIVGLQQGYPGQGCE